MRRLFAIFLIVLMAPLAGQAGTAEERPVLQLVGNVWPPYVSDKLPGYGVAVELVVTALKRAGYEVSGSFQPWSRALEGGRLGVYDVIVAAWRTPDRERDLHFSRPYLTSRILFVKRSGAPIEFHTLDDLRGLVIGVVQDYAYGGGLDQAEGLVKVPARTAVQNLLKLRQGQIDLSLGDEWALMYQVAEHMPHAASEFEFLPHALAERGIHIAVSRANSMHDRIVADFDAAIAAMKADGSYEKIIEKHERLLPRLGD